MGLSDIVSQITGPEYKPLDKDPRVIAMTENMKKGGMEHLKANFDDSPDGINRRRLVTFMCLVCLFDIIVVGLAASFALSHMPAYNLLLAAALLSVIWSAIFSSGMPI